MFGRYFRELIRLAWKSSWAAANGIEGAALAGFATAWFGPLTIIPGKGILAALNWLLSYLLYVIPALVLIFVIRVIFIAPFQLWKSRADFSDVIRANVYARLAAIDPEPRRELYRIVTGEIEAQQLNVEAQSALERAGFLRHAVNYNPPAFIETHGQRIEQWFRENPP